MNPIRLQKLVVLAHHDPAFLQNVKTDPSASARRWNCEVSELDMLLRLDPRLFRTDPLRGPRLLTGLLDRFPVTAWSLLSTELFPRLRSFVASDEFYNVVLHDGYLHQGFSRFLSRLFPDKCPLIELECALEDVKSCAFKTPQGLLEICIHPAVRLVRVPTGLLDTYLTARKTIEASNLGGAGFLLAPERSALSVAALAEKGREHVLLEPGQPVRVGTVNASLAALLEFVKIPRTKAAVVQELIGHGVELNEVEDLLTQFYSESWITGQLFSPRR